MRTYEKTHPWIKFLLDLRELEHSTWLLLGEAVSKTEHIAGVPLDPDAAKTLHAVYLAKGVLATTAIEGNTLTEDEVRDHLEGRLKLPPSRQYLGQEIDNIVEACNRIGQEIIRDGSGPISVQDILEYNKLVLRELPLQEDVMPGELRRHSIVVGRYRGAPAEDCEFLLNKFCEWLNSLEFPKGLEQSYSILAAIAAHLYLVWIHPFGDGNGRTARLIEFRFLLQAGFPTPAAHLLSNFYNLNSSLWRRQWPHGSADRVSLSAAGRFSDTCGPPPEQLLQPDSNRVLPSIGHSQQIRRSDVGVHRLCGSGLGGPASGSTPSDPEATVGYNLAKLRLRTFRQGIAHAPSTTQTRS